MCLLLSFHILGRTDLLVVVGLRAPASSWLSSGGCTQFKPSIGPCHVAFSRGSSQHNISFLQVQQKIVRLQCAKIETYMINKIMGVISHHLYHMLLVRSKSKVLPIREGRDYTGQHQEQNHGGLPRTLPTTSS